MPGYSRDYMYSNRGKRHSGERHQTRRHASVLRTTIMSVYTHTHGPFVYTARVLCVCRFSRRKKTLFIYSLKSEIHCRATATLRKLSLTKSTERRHLFSCVLVCIPLFVNGTRIATCIYGNPSYAFNVNTAGWILKTCLVSPPAFCYTNAINRSGETIAT